MRAFILSLSLFIEAYSALKFVLITVGQSHASMVMNPSLCDLYALYACTETRESCGETLPVMGIASTRIPLRAASDAMRRPTGVTGVTSPYPT